MRQTKISRLPGQISVKCDAKLTVNLLEELAVARRERGMTQSDLAARTGTDRQGIHRLEHGVGSLDLLVRVMVELNFHIVGLARGRYLPEQLRNRRHNLRLSKLDTARRASITPATLVRMEAGGGSITTILKVLDAIGGTKMARQKHTPSILTPHSTGDRDKRFTPVALLEKLEKVWGEIDLDPCAHIESPVRAKRRILVSEGGDGLRDEWCGHFAYMNPPYSGAALWLKRADEMHAAGKVGVVVALVPARTESAYFQDHIAGRCDVGFVRGRIQFGREAGAPPDKRNHAPFPVMLIIWGASSAQIEHFRTLQPSVWMLRERGECCAEQDVEIGMVEAA